MNFVALSEITEEYHIELYGYLEYGNKLNEFRNEQTKISYIEIVKEKGCYKEKPREVSLSEYIRHQIHHPENKKNERYTFEQLGQSINLMRDFIDTLSEEMNQ